MGKPVILAVDDDTLVLAAVQRDLRNRYSEEYTVVGVTSGREALGILEEIIGRGGEAALLVADQRMPEMTGVQFLLASRRLFPDAARVLLTAYADTEAAIAAINEAGVEYYILKPWDPPEDKLFPPLDDLLEGWRARYQPSFSGIRVLGERWSPATNHLKEFLARNQVPYRAVEIDGEEGRLLLETMDAKPGDLPLLVFDDGRRLFHPETAEVAEAVGLRTQAELPTYDLVIVGGGPAGLAAAVYAGSEGLRTLLAEEEAPGGQAGQSSRIENYLGFPAGLSGADLARRAVMQARRFGVEMLVPVQATAMNRLDPFRIVHFASGGEVNAKAVLVATGVSYRMLPAEDADRFTGAGIFYGASAVEAALYRDEDVAVIGAGNSAGQAALYLAGFAHRVHVLTRRASLLATMSSYLVDRIAATENITVINQCQVTKARGDGRLSQLLVEKLNDEPAIELDVAAAFVFIGQLPRTEWLGGTLARDDQGFIITGPESLSAHPPGWDTGRAPFPLETSVPGVFAAGDVRAGSTKRVASAAGEGAMAVTFVHQHLGSL